jgi:DNA-binding GntR family transcriptional regulator
MAPSHLKTPMSETEATPRLQIRALYEQVAEQLRNRIFAGELKTGEWIDELKLAKEYGISRTPLREALKVLETEGLVEIKLRRGAYVALSSVQQLRDIFHLLALLESDAAAVVAKAKQPDQIQALEVVHQTLKKSIENRNQFFAANEQFHDLLLQFAGNDIAINIVRDLRKKMKFNRHHSLFKEGRIDESMAEHESMMAAIRAGDAVLTQALMQAHLRRGMEAAT